MSFDAPTTQTTVQRLGESALSQMEQVFQAMGEAIESGHRVQTSALSRYFGWSSTTINNHVIRAAKVDDQKHIADKYKELREKMAGLPLAAPDDLFETESEEPTVEVAPSNDKTKALVTIIGALEGLDSVDAENVIRCVIEYHGMGIGRYDQ